LTVRNLAWDLQAQHFAGHAGWRRHPLSARSRLGAIRGG
jgi:predicted hotdog family 3-hydroxylacyl-ACP dehydratase